MDTIRWDIIEYPNWSDQTDYCESVEAVMYRPDTIIGLISEIY
jgi:hypothetical protein